MEIRFEMLEAVGFQHWESLSNQACEVACVGFLCQRRPGEVEEIIAFACSFLSMVEALGEQWEIVLKELLKLF